MSFWRIYEKIENKSNKKNHYPWVNRRGWLSFFSSFKSKIAEKLLQHKTTLKKNISKQTTADLEE